MKMHEVRIEGFKSIREIQLVDPNPFTVFVGPNASGKSNIFEALEFFALCNSAIPQQVIESFGNIEDILNLKHDREQVQLLNYFFDLGSFKPRLQTSYLKSSLKEWSYVQYGEMFHVSNPELSKQHTDEQRRNNRIFESLDYLHFTNFTKLFIGGAKNVRLIKNDLRLSPEASNLEKVLKRIFMDETSRSEINEILQLLIPGFSRVEIKTEQLSGNDHLVIYEDTHEKPLPRHLISDGTYNIIALITAVYQSNEPQFLCIEEPENGLNPKVIKQLVHLFRQKCMERGHYIWLNSHSQTLVSELMPHELILVDKVNGSTCVKQVKDFDLRGMKMDEALLTNALGGGVPW